MLKLFIRLIVKIKKMKNKSVRILIATSLIFYSIFTFTQVLQQNHKKQYFLMILNLLIIGCYLIGAIFHLKNTDEKISS
ncbi:MAG: hypothetical protein RLZZ628_2383 [Bacteroidota bacterium]|jgi:hypothetical protein